MERGEPDADETLDTAAGVAALTLYEAIGRRIVTTTRLCRCCCCSPFVASLTPAARWPRCVCVLTLGLGLGLGVVAGSSSSSNLTAAVAAPATASATTTATLGLFCLGLVGGLLFLFLGCCRCCCCCLSSGGVDAPALGEAPFGELENNLRC